MSLFICFGDVKRPAHLRQTQNYVLQQNSVLQQGPLFSATSSCSPPKGKFIPSVLSKEGLVLFNREYFQHMCCFIFPWRFGVQIPNSFGAQNPGVSNMQAEELETWVFKMKVKLPLFWSPSLQIKDMTARAILCEKRVRSTKHFEPQSDIIHFIWSVLVSSQNERNTKRSWVSTAFGFLFKSETLKWKDNKRGNINWNKKGDLKKPKRNGKSKLCWVSSAVMTWKLSSLQSGKLYFFKQWKRKSFSQETDESGHFRSSNFKNNSHNTNLLLQRSVWLLWFIWVFVLFVCFCFLF